MNCCSSVHSWYHPRSLSPSLPVSFPGAPPSQHSHSHSSAPSDGAHSEPASQLDLNSASAIIQQQQQQIQTLLQVKGNRKNCGRVQSATPTSVYVAIQRIVESALSGIYMGQKTCSCNARALIATVQILDRVETGMCIERAYHKLGKTFLGKLHVHVCTCVYLYIHVHVYVCSIPG